MKTMFHKLGLASVLVALLMGCVQPPTPPSSDIEVSDENNNTVTAQAIPTNGLKGDYYDNLDFTGTLKTRYDATVNKAWNSSAPITGIQPITYSVRWTGQIMPTFSETYTFTLSYADGARLMVNGQVLVNDWVDGAKRTKTGTVALQANTKYDIRLEYYRNVTNAGAVKLEWQSSSRTKQVVPQASLFTTGSNADIALAVLSADPGFKAINFQNESQTTNASIEGNEITLFSLNLTDGKFVIARVKDNAVLSFFTVFAKNGYLYYQDSIRRYQQQALKLDGIDLQNLTTDQMTELMVGYAKAFSGNAMTISASITSGGGRLQTQGVYDAFLECTKKLTPPLDCEGRCATDAERFKKAVCGQSETFITISVGLLIPVIDDFVKGRPKSEKLQKWWGQLSSLAKSAKFASGVAAVGVLTAVSNGQKNIESAYADLLKCMERFKDYDCKPTMSPIPSDYTFTKSLGQNGTESIPFIGNSRYSKTGLNYTFTTSNDNTSQMYILPGSWGNYLSPGGGESIDAIYFCPSTPTTIRSRVTITSNTSVNVVSPLTVTVTLICGGEPKISVSPNPLSLVAAINSATTGTLTVSNTGTAPLEVSRVESNQGWLTVPPAGFTVAPGSSQSVDVKGTCDATAGTKLSATVTFSSTATNGSSSAAVTLECFTMPVSTIRFATIGQYGACGGGVSISFVAIDVQVSAVESVTGTARTVNYYPSKRLEWPGCTDFTNNINTTQREDEKVYISPESIQGAAALWQTFAKAGYSLRNPRFAPLPQFGYIAELVQTNP
jgi:PA14 domain/Viral BACON domain